MCEHRGMYRTLSTPFVLGSYVVTVEHLVPTQMHAWPNPRHSPLLEDWG